MQQFVVTTDTIKAAVILVLSQNSVVSPINLVVNCLSYLQKCFQIVTSQKDLSWEKQKLCI